MAMKKNLVILSGAGMSAYIGELQTNRKTKQDRKLKQKVFPP